MDGIHDLGGTQGFGHIDVEADEPVFHHPWQRTSFALMMATQIILRSHNADEYRHAIERMDPAHYLLCDYYERVLTGTVSLLVDKGYLSREDVERRAGGCIRAGWAGVRSAPSRPDPTARGSIQPGRSRPGS